MKILKRNHISSALVTERRLISFSPEIQRRAPEIKSEPNKTTESPAETIKKVEKTLDSAKKTIKNIGKIDQKTATELQKRVDKLNNINGKQTEKKLQVQKTTIANINQTISNDPKLQSALKTIKNINQKDLAGIGSPKQTINKINIPSNVADINIANVGKNINVVPKVNIKVPNIENKTKVADNKKTKPLGTGLL